MIFDAISYNIYKVLSVNPSPNVFDIHHKDWLTYYCGTDRPGELCYNFSISNDLTQMVNFPTRIYDLTLTVPLFWMVSLTISETFHGRISLKLVPAIYFFFK